LRGKKRTLTKTGGEEKYVKTNSSLILKKFFIEKEIVKELERRLIG